MTTETGYTPNPLRQAYNAAIIGAGREAANVVCKAHGVTDNGLHPWRRVEPSKQAACIAALDALAGTTSKTPTPKPHPAAVRSFESVRRESFARIGTEKREAAPKTLNAESIYSKWNSAKRSDEE